jgi:hypothetical protein
LEQMLANSRLANGRILNALTFPMPWVGISFEQFSSECRAWYATEGLPFCKSTEAFPISDMRWGLAGTTGAKHWWHIDSDGFGTFIDVQTGSKWWIIARPKVSTEGIKQDDFSAFADINLFLGDFELEKPLSEHWDLEAIYLEPGTRLWVAFSVRSVEKLKLL